VSVLVYDRERMGDIRAGMTKDQVIAVLGTPDGFAQSGQLMEIELGGGASGGTA
jgi:hypothetical protein